MKFLQQHLIPITIRLLFKILQLASVILHLNSAKRVVTCILSHLIMRFCIYKYKFFLCFNNKNWYHVCAELSLFLHHFQRLLLFKSFCNFFFSYKNIRRYQKWWHERRQTNNYCAFIKCIPGFEAKNLTKNNAVQVGNRHIIIVSIRFSKDNHC